MQSVCGLFSIAIAANSKFGALARLALVVGKQQLSTFLKS
jgi:hypothetical protein